MDIILTSREINQLLSEDVGPFKHISDRIPMEPGEDISSFIEDDGRQYRSCQFLDTRNNQEYYFNYIFYPDDYSDCPLDFLDNPGITVVKESVLFPPKPKVEVAPVLTEAEQKDKIMMDTYRATNVRPFTSVKDSGIPQSKIKEICLFLKDLKNNKGTFLDLRQAIIPTCIQYGIEQKSFWQFLQNEHRKKKYTPKTLEM